MADEGPKGFGIVLLIALFAGYWWLNKQADSPAYHHSLSEWWSSPSPIHRVDAPKMITADDVIHIACTGEILVFSPSREIVASGGEKKSYEIVFFDDRDEPQDLKHINSFEMSDAPNATYAVSQYANPQNTSTTYSNGTAINVGDVLTFADKGRARWEGAGKWEPVRCKSD